MVKKGKITTSSPEKCPQIWRGDRKLVGQPGSPQNAMPGGAEMGGPPNELGEKLVPAAQTSAKLKALMDYLSEGNLDATAGKNPMPGAHGTKSKKGNKGKVKNTGG